MKSTKIRVEGKVHGVYFRVSAKQKAMNLGVYGYVKNEKDGTVTVEAEGEEKALDSMIRWCKNGPGLARVSNIRVEEHAAQNFIAFDIRK